MKGVDLSVDGVALDPEPMLTNDLRRSLENMYGRIVPQVDAILASSSAASLYCLATWLSSRPCNLSSSLHTSLQ